MLTEFDCLRSSHSPGSHSVNGTLGAGTGHISVTTLSGRVTLLSRAPQAGTDRKGPPQAEPPQGAARDSDRRDDAAQHGGSGAGQPQAGPADSGGRGQDPWAAATDPAPSGGGEKQDDAQTKGETR